MPTRQEWTEVLAPDARSGLLGLINKATDRTESTLIRRACGERIVAALVPVGHGGELLIPHGLNFRQLPKNGGPRK